jgi:hypothetical protein
VGKSKGKAFITILTAVAVFLGSFVPVSAFSENESRSVEKFFVEAQLLKGDGSGYGLKNAPTRLEGMIILIRLLGKDGEAMEMQSLPCRFTDVPAWAVGYANYAYAEKLSEGVSKKLFGSSEPMTAQQFHTLMLRVIGYDDRAGDFRWSRAVEAAEELGILPADMSQRYDFANDYTKKDLIETAFCFLGAPYKDGSGTLAQKLLDTGVISEELSETYGLAVDKWYQVTTNSGDEEYLNFKLVDKEIRITGKSPDKEKEWLLVQINNIATGAKKAETVSKQNSAGKYELSIFTGNLAKGDYYVDVYGNNEKYNYYNSILHSSLILRVEGKDTAFVVSPVYGQNLRIYKGNALEAQDRLINLETRLTKESIQTVRDLAAEITAGCTTDYEKAEAIHDWVADNIYYDYDYLNGITQTTNITTLSVLENKYAVCSGYANLTRDLLTAAGIPCKQVMGYALGVAEEEDDWSDIDQQTVSPNHVWNEAYVDGRWLIMDTTWDSSNGYEGEKFTKGENRSRLYFDITTQFLSNTHKSIY